MGAAKFDWSQYPTEDAAQPIAQGKGKFDWNQFPAEGEKDSGPGFLTHSGRAILGGITQAGQTIDSYGGAPTRAAIASLQNGGGASGAMSAFKNQFGSDPNLAPTGKDIAAKAGFSTDALLSPNAQKLASAAIKSGPLGFIADKAMPGSVENAVSASPAAIVGTGINVAADPMTYVPVGDVAKGIVGSVAKSADAIGEGATALGRTASTAGTKAVSKLGSVLTGVPEQEIKTYIEQYPQVQKLIADHGDDISGAANQIRQGFQDSVRARRAQLGQQVGNALNKLPDQKVVPIAPVVDALNQVKNRMNSSLRFEEVNQVNDLADRIGKLADANGNVTPKEMFDIKQFLQDRGTGSYMKDGQIFVPGKDAQIAAKNGAAQARQIVNTMSPTVADANNELSRLHDIQDKMNKNLIAPGNPDAALAGAGNGLNAKNAADLKQLGDVAGADMLSGAQQYAAAKRFASPGLSSADTNGKGVERALKAGIVGQAFGGPIAGGIAAVATSPMALKLGIQAGRIPVAAIQKIAGATGNLTDATIQRAYQILKTPEGQSAFNAALQGAKAESIGGKASLRNVASPPNQQPDNTSGNTNYADGGLVEDTKKKTLGQLIGYPDSDPEPEKKAPKPHPQPPSNNEQQQGQTLGHIIGYPGMQAGGMVPGRALYHGNNKKNDSVTAKLSPGEVVIPRSVMESHDPASGAKEFVKGIIQQKGGEDHWVAQGIEKLGIQDNALTQRLLQDPKGRQLLIQASDLKSGSQAMKKVMNQIQKGWGKP
jgi:hypothetical protein